MVIDGVSSDEILHNINLALPQNNPGSGIIITTGSGDVVELFGTYSSSYVHPMMPLTFKESLCLFGSIIFGSVRSCRVGLEKDFEEIVKACRGVPLVIRVIAGALSSKPAEMEHRKSTYAKIIEGIDQQNAGWIQEILSICYSDLSCDMKTCLLYLCSFPENHVVRMDRLIRRWVSEGFLTQISEETSWEVGERYFVELISRKLIEPVYDEEDVLPTGCTVGGSIYDFITSQSSEENFIKLDVPNETIFMHHGSDNYMTRLALVQGKLSSKVRSLTFVCDYFGTIAMPYLSAFSHLRVLDLGDTKGMEIKQPETIGGLSLLRYLGLGGTDLTKLPEEITALENLSTLDLRRTRVTNVPKFRGCKMVSLLGDQLIFVRGRGMDGMQKLEELSQVLVGPDGSPADYMAELVNEMGRLRMLGVRFSHLYDHHNEMGRKRVKHFLEEMSKSKLQSLLLYNYGESLFDILVETWANKRTPYLRKFELTIRGCLPLDPQKIASLIALTHLIIHVPEAEAQGVGALGELPQLVLLNLYADTSTRLTVSSNDGFRCLKVFRYHCQCGGGMGLQFGAGAMPQLQRLWLDFNARETMSKYGGFDFGIQHLSRLVQVCATIDCKDTTASEVEHAEADIRAQASRNPNNPVLELNRRGHDHLTPHQGLFFIVEAARDSVIEIHSLDEWRSQIEYAKSSNKLLLIKFTASWCGPSRRIAPFFSDLANKFANVVFLKVDVDEMEDIAEEFEVKAMPTFLFMIGGHVKDTVRGAYEEQLLKKLNKLQMA
jgi:disease resistance protein RPM1